MKPFTLAALGGLAYGVFLAATLPVAVVAPRLEAATGGRVSVTQPEGSVFAGRAALDIRTPGQATVHVDSLAWQWRPSALLAGRLAAGIEARVAGLALTGEVARTPGTWQLSDAEARGDAAALAILHPLLSRWTPSGTLAASAPQLAWDGRELRGAASGEWRDATLALSAVRPLGTWRAELAAEGGPAKLKVATVKGPLRLAGDGTLSPQGVLAFRGEARAEPGREQDLEELLALLGPKRADGARTLEAR